jgi:hypothetical protein
MQPAVICNNSDIKVPREQCAAGDNESKQDMTCVCEGESPSTEAFSLSPSFSHPNPFPRKDGSDTFILSFPYVNTTLSSLYTLSLSSSPPAYTLLIPLLSC